MSRFLGLDIGNRRTGVAYFDDDTGIVLPVTTIDEKNQKTLVEKILTMCRDRKIDQLVIGIPLLPSGEEGEQAKIVRSVGDVLHQSLPVEYLDERYSSHPLREKGQKGVHDSDRDTWAACQLLNLYLERKNRI